MKSRPTRARGLLLSGLKLEFAKTMSIYAIFWSNCFILKVQSGLSSNFT